MQEKLKNGTVWLSFAPKTYPHYSGHSSYHFAISTAEKCFGRILTTFLGLSTTGVIKFENRAWMTQFWQPKYPHYLGRISSRFLFLRVKTVLDKFLRLFRARARPELEKLKAAPKWLGLVPEKYLHFLGCNSYHFPSLWQKNVSVEFWWLFWARSPPAQPQSWKSSPD